MKKDLIRKEIKGMKTEERITQEQEQEKREEARIPDKADYMKRIMALSAEDQAFLDGYLFAKVTATRTA